MNLKSLELSGFKSFGKKTVLEFKTPITSIVGPNGSGKSNVAEAFRFVLGEQSLKSMRGKKGEDLIFNGSADMPRGNRAQVKLVFKNENRIFNLDFDEVSIERSVYRDGTNEYSINGTKVRLKDVLELLAGAHVGASGHHIISQGEADRILHANERERREMIEDALGIKVYKYKKEESERKLEKTDENIKQVESLRREIAPHLKFLKKQVEKIEKGEELRRELITLSQEYFYREEKYIKEEAIKIKQEKSAPEHELKTLSENLTRAKKTVESGLKNGESAPEIIALEEKLQNVRYEKDDLIKDEGKIEGEISYVERSLAKENETEEKEEKSVPLSFVEKLFKTIVSELQRGEEVGTLEALRSALYESKKQVKEFIDQYSHGVVSKAKERLEQELKGLKDKKNILNKKLEDIRFEEKKLVDEYQKKRNELEKAKDETKDAEKEVFRIIARQNELHAILDKINSREASLRYEEELFKSDMHEIGKIAGIEALRFESVSVELDNSREEQQSRKKQLERLKIRLEEAGVVGGDEVLKEYKETEERDTFLARELEDLKKASEDLVVLIKELEEKLDQEFRDGVLKINDAFEKFFTLMFGGGKASLRVIKQEKRRRKNTEEGGEDENEEENPEFEEGIDIEVSLPHKKIKGLMMLSGGERALTSIALLFAISQVNPPPFVILDETDAALDEANSRKYGDMIEALAKNSQLIVITHNRETMSRAGVLYGVTMGKDAVSKLLSIAFDEAVEVAK